jgi:competence protein ComEC
LVLLSLGLLVFLGGALYSASVRSGSGEQFLSSHNNRGVVGVRGTVSRDPEVGPTATRLRLSVSEILGEGEWQAVSGVAVLYLPRYPEYRYGDILAARGSLEGTLLQELDWPSTSDASDYSDYLSSQGVHSVMLYPEVELLASGKGSSPLGWVYGVRNRMSAALAAVLPEPQAALAQSIILGMRTAMPADLKDDFSISGTTHLLAISGVNLTIVAGMLVTTTVGLFGRKHHLYVWLTLVTIWFYAVLTGLQPPILRAAIMLSIFLAASLFGRQRSGVISLFLSAAIMVGFSPTIFRDPSFQLSFAAMAGMVIVCPPLQTVTRKAIERAVEEGKIRAVTLFVADSLVVSLTAVIAVWPLIAYYFGIVSWIGVPATFATLPAMPAIIVTGMASACLGLIFLPLGQIIGWLAWLPLSYLLLAVTAFASVPGASIETGPVGLRLVAVYYGLLVVALCSWQYRVRLSATLVKVADFLRGLRWKWVAASFGVLAMAAWLIAATMPDDQLHVSFLNVGQGDAVLIEKGHHQILVDGGPDPRATLLELAAKMPFWDRTIDMVILTHPHADHLTGLVDVVKRYRVKRVLSADLSDDSPLFSEWQRQIDLKGITRDVVTRGYSAHLGSDVTLTVLNPGQSLLTGTGSQADDNCVVVKVDAGRIGFLLAGDITREVEMEMIGARAALDSTVLKVAHHGSARSTGDEFLAVVTPRAVVISVGAGNGYGHPHDAVVDRLAAHVGAESIYRTDEHGTVEFVTDGERLWVKTARR